MSEFSVLNMINKDNVDDVFKVKSDEVSTLKDETTIAPTDTNTIENESVQDNVMDAMPTIDTTNVEPTNEKKPWTPDPELLEGLDTVQYEPVTYSADEYKETSDQGKKNILDEDAKRNALSSMDELDRIDANINYAKQRWGIDKLQIPDGVQKTKIINAAADTNYDRAKTNLDVLFNSIVRDYPDFVVSWIGDAKPENIAAEDETHPNIDDVEVKKSDDGTVSIIIDKSNIPQISWNREELEKIRKSRTIELNIKETIDLKYNNIEEVNETNMVDKVLSQYTAKVNSVTAALPASKYRATFKGLSYSEVMDLSHAQDINNYDGERKKWSIAFNHIVDQSIGPWESYDYYIKDGDRKKFDHILTNDEKDAIEAEGIELLHHSKFDDFLTKTSFIDIDYILWKILCATTMEKEIITLTCGHKTNNKTCNKNYDWLYSPSELLVTEKISNVILDELVKTSEVSSLDDIIENYNESMLNTNNIIELHSSGFGVLFGHISAYEYLSNVYSIISETIKNPDDLSHEVNASLLTIIKAFLIKSPDGHKTYKIVGADNIIKIIDSLNEIDWLSISNVAKEIITPYQFEYKLKDTICPECGYKSDVAISSMSNLLFIVAQSLVSVQITLKKA